MENHQNNAHTTIAEQTPQRVTISKVPLETSPADQQQPSFTPLPSWKPVDNQLILRHVNNLKSCLSLDVASNQTTPSSFRSTEPAVKTSTTTDLMLDAFLNQPSFEQEFNKTVFASPPAVIPAAKYERWTEVEDDFLRRAVAVCGGGPPYAWSTISRDFFLGARTMRQCQSRWARISSRMKPALEVEELQECNSGWLHADKERLVELVFCIGEQWDVIGTHFPGQSPASCRKMWEDIAERNRRREARHEVFESSGSKKE